MEKREHDIFLDMASNPGMTFDNLVVAGLNANNTALLDRDAYKKDEWVQSQFKNDFGEFDEAGFNKFYDAAKTYYNYLANADYNESMKRQTVYHRNNMYAPPELKAIGPLFHEYKAPNPYGITESMITIGLGGERTKSIDELALAYRVLLNPTSAGENLLNAEWGDAPNDSLMGSKYWLDTLVLAQYDEDGEYTNLFTGLKEFHKKGELKTDDLGNFYYEKLDGRNVYGRRVLNKMNVLTTDGSWINQYDFFDSDDLEQKSIGGTIMKNLALVGTMFLPYVGPWIAGLSVATQLMGVFGTMGKMLTSSDNSFLSELEGWSKSVNRQTAKTEYAQENTWCWENFIDLIGDVMGLLKEQRFVFEKVPVLFKGNTMVTSANQEARLAALTLKEEALLATKIENLKKDGDKVWQALKAAQEKSGLAALSASAKLNLFNKEYLTLGYVLGRGYMTAITVGDTYGEAKNNGATDFEATMLTLGYAAGEYAILSTGIGEWFFPEVRNSGLRNKYLAEALANYKLTDEAKNVLKQLGKEAAAVGKEEKKLAAKKLFNLGKNIARSTYIDGSRGLKASLAAGIGESVEEVSEELLADFSKGAYNTVLWLRGIDTRLDSFGFSWEDGVRSWNSLDLIDRYGMSAVGGFIGGGLTNAGTNYKLINDYKSMTSERARLELVYMARNGELPEFVKSLKKMQIGNTNLDPLNYEIKKDGTVEFMPGTETNNQDLYIKSLIELECRTIDAFLKAEGGVSDNVFLNKMVLEDLRFNALLSSATAGMYLQEYNSLLSSLIADLASIKLKMNSIQDTNNNGLIEDYEARRNKLSKEDLDWIKGVEKRMKETRLKISDLLEGKRSYEFILDALFEMTADLSGIFNKLSNFALYVLGKYGRDLNDLTEEEKNKAYEEYKTIKASEGRELLSAISRQFNYILGLASSVIKASTDTYLNISKLMRSFNALVSDLYSSFFVNGESRLDADLLEAQLLTDNSPGYVLKYLLNYFAKPADIEALNKEAEKLDQIDPALSELEKAEERNKINISIDNLALKILIDNILELVKPFTDLGFIEYEVKDLLLTLLNTVLDPINIQWSARNAKIEEDIATAVDPDAVDTTNIYEKPYLALNEAIKQIEKLTYTPLQLNLNNFLVSLGVNDPINVMDLIEKVNTLFDLTSSEINQYNLGETLSKELDLAIRILNLYEAALKASRVDNVDLNNIFGYSITLNEIAKRLGESRPELAEIDMNTANLFILDIRDTRAKLMFLQRLYKVNQGLKLTRNDRVAVNKELLLYKRLKYIVNVPDDDPLKTWNKFDELKTIVESLNEHENLLNSGKLVVDENIKDAYYQEDIKLKLAIYDFIQANRDEIINNPTKLSELINPTKLLLYTKADGLLTEETKELDDNAFVWLIATMGAVNAKDFYGEFHQIIQTLKNGDEKVLAPIATHEMATYTNYASIVDPDLFKAFYITYRQTVKDHWKSLNLAERELIFNNLKKTPAEKFLISDDLADYALNFLSTPRYSNIVLTEGIPGSGKTFSVFLLTALLLQKFHPELLENVVVVSGIKTESAEAILNNLKLDKTKSKVFNRENFMKYINTNWTEYSKDAKGNYIIPDTDYTLDSDNLMRYKGNVNTLTTEIPKVIFIDEISKFSAYDLDLIEKFAEKHGITVIAAGDFDLMGVEGSHKITNIPAIVGKDNTVGLSRTDFIRTPKLGVSMRTSNSLKNTNLLSMLIFMQDPNAYNGKLEFKYFEDENGIHGDKVFAFHSTDLASVITEVKELVKKLIETLKPGEKIGYIYFDENTEFYKELTKPENHFIEYLDLKKGGTAQGEEGRYYITEANYKLENLSDYLRLVYTGLTRAELGSIIIAPLNSNNIQLKSVLNSENVNEPLSDDSKIAYAKRRKELLEKISLGALTVELKPRSTTGTSNNTPLNTPPPNTPPPGNPPGGTPPPSGPSGGTNTRTPINLDSYPFNIGDKLEIYHNDGSLDRIVTIVEAYLDRYGRKLRVLDNTLTTNNITENLNLDDVNNQFGSKYKLATSPDPEAHLVELLPPTISNLFDLLGNINNYKQLLDRIANFTTYLNTNNSLDLDRLNVEVSMFEVDNNIDSNDFPELKAAIDKRRRIILDKLSLQQRYQALSEQIENVTNLKDLRILNNTYSLDGTFDEFADLLQMVLDKWVRLEAERKTKVLGEIANATTVEELEKILSDNEVDEDTETTLIEAYKKKVLELQEAELDDVYNNELEDPADSLVPEGERKVDLDEANKTKILPLSSVNIIGKACKISMLLHSFNTFELGVKVGLNGMAQDIDGMPGSMEKRIDSVNGLRKIDKFLGRPERTVSEYIELLGDLRKIIYNTPNKTQLIQKLENKLGLLNLYCNFALKISAHSGDSNRANNRTLVSSNLHPLDKSYEETTLYNESDDTNSLYVHPKSLVLVLGNNQTNNILELPLLALSSPFTLLQVQTADFSEPFAPIRNRFELLRNTEAFWKKDRAGNIIRNRKGQPVPKLYEIANVLYEEFKNVEEFKEITDLLKLYTINNNAIFFIDDNNWTLAGNLLNKGPVVTTEEGYYQIVDGLEFNDTTNPDWIELDSFAKGEFKGHLETIGLSKNPVCSVTKRIMISKTGTIEDSDGNTVKVCNPSHPFVLVSYADNLISDTDIYNYFIRLETENLPKKVKLMYVLPPHTDIKGYIDNILNIILKKSKIPIGTLFTSYRVMKILMQSDEFKARLNEKLSGAVERVQQALDSLEGKEGYLLSNALKKKYDWGDIGDFPKGNRSLAGLFDGILYKIAYNINDATPTGKREIVPNESDIAMIERILKQGGVDKIFYHAILKKGTELPAGMQFQYPILEDGYMLDGKPFMIHGKIDLPTFEGHLGSFISSVVNLKLKVNGREADGKIIYGSTDTDSRYYKMSNGLGRFVNASRRTVQPSNTRRLNIRQTIQNNIINKTETQLVTAFEGRTPYLKLLTPEKYFEGKSLEQGLNDLINDINTYTNAMAFSIGTDFFILKGRELFKNDLRLLDNNGNVITDIKPLFDNNGETSFRLQYDGNKEASVSFDSTGTLEFTYPSDDTEVALFTNVTPTNFANYVELGKSFLNPILSMDISLKKLFNATTLEEFNDLAKKVVYLEDEGLSLRLLDLATLNPQSSEELQLVQDIKALDEYARKKKDGNCTISSFKITL